MLAFQLAPVRVTNPVAVSHKAETLVMKTRDSLFFDVFDLLTGQSRELTKMRQQTAALGSCNFCGHIAKAFLPRMVSFL